MSSITVTPELVDSVETSHGISLADHFTTAACDVPTRCYCTTTYTTGKTLVLFAAAGCVGYLCGVKLVDSLKRRKLDKLRTRMRSECEYKARYRYQYIDTDSLIVADNKESRSKVISTNNLLIPSNKQPPSVEGIPDVFIEDEGTLEEQEASIMDFDEESST